MYLTSKISKLPKVGPILTRKFEKLGISTIEDLFYHVPSRYIDFSKVLPIAKVQVGETVTVHAEFQSIKNVYTRRGLRMQIGSVKDSSGKIQVVWFNQPFLIKTFYPGKRASLSGEVKLFSGRPALVGSEYEALSEEDVPTLHTGRLVPVYPETSGLSSKWIRRTIQNAFVPVEIDEYLPVSVLHQSKLSGIRQAFREVHFP